MVSLILFGSFFVLLLINVPIGLSLGISSVAALIAENLPFSMIPSNLYSSTGKFVLLAIPFFILGGNVMEKSGISARLIDFCRTLWAIERAVWLWSASSWLASLLPSPAPAPPQWLLWA